MADTPSFAEFGASFKQFIDRVNAQTPTEEPFFPT